MSPSIASRLRGGVIAGLGAALLLGACSHDSTAPIASAARPGQAATPTSAPPPAEQSNQEAVRKYVASVRAYAGCARAAGVDMPDPDASGNLNPPADLKQKVQADPAKNARLNDCAKKLIDPPASLAYPDLTPAQFAKAKKLAVCMRAHGVPAYPDPSIHTSPDPDPGNSAAAAFSKLASTPAYQKALNTCSVIVYGHEGVG